MNKEDLIGKFIVAFDTIVDGEQTATNEDDLPTLHESEDEAFKELFDDAATMLDGYTPREVRMYCEGVTMDMVQKMKELNSGTDIEAMRQFLKENPQCNVNNEYVVKAEDFVKGKKIIFKGSN